MWQQSYTPVADSLPLSALVAAVPVFVLLYLLGVKRKPAWMASLAGLAGAALVAAFVYRMPPGKLIAAVSYGAAFGLFPIGWIVFAAILIYRVSVESGRFEVLKDSVGQLTSDRRLQALLIAFAFGAFLEGAAGFGAPVAVAASMLTGLGFAPFYAAGICLLANTAPVAFGSIAIPIVTLAATTGLPFDRLSAGVGRICAPVSLFVPAYLILVMGGWRALRGVLPAVAACGIAFAGTQFVVSNFISAQLTDILSSLAAIASLVILMKLWQPSDEYAADELHMPAPAGASQHHSGRDIAVAWAPYALLVIFILLWGQKPVQHFLDSTTLAFQWPGLHNQILRMAPAVPKPAPYPAAYNFNWLAASGTACLLAALLSTVVVKMSPRRFLKVVVGTAKQMAVAELTLAAVLALAYLMNYSGATATLGLAFAATGVLFPFFSALLGWVGVFLTGSDTSANALFGNLQVVTANKLGMNPVLMASSNSAGGVMGKMISLTSIAVAAAATAMKPEDESKLFRFTLRHSVFLTMVIAAIVVFYAYVMPQWAP
jgi:L-lactate transport